jgi:hypothetical protein
VSGKHRSNVGTAFVLIPNALRAMARLIQLPHCTEVPNAINANGDLLLLALHLQKDTKK